MRRLGVLDQSPVRSGGVVADAIHETLELAELCDRLGFHRYWLAQHHSTPRLAGSSPQGLVGPGPARPPPVPGRSRGGTLPPHKPPQVAQKLPALPNLLSRPVE